MRSYTLSLGFRYLFGVAPVNADETLGGLHILYPRQEANTPPVPRQALGWALQPGQDIHYDLACPTAESAGRLVALALPPKRA